MRNPLASAVHVSETGVDPAVQFLPVQVGSCAPLVGRVSPSLGPASIFSLD